MDRFIDFILPELPGVPEALIKSHVLLAAITFCKDSWAWQEIFSEDIAAELDTITLECTAANAEIIGLRNVKFNDYEFNAYVAGRDTTQPDAGDYVLTLDNSSSAGTLTGTLVLRPIRTATALSNILYTKYFDAIIAQAKSTLAMMPNKPWSDPGTSAIQRKIYMKEMVDAKIEANRENTVKPLRVTSRTF